MPDTTLVEMDCKTALSNIDDLGILSVKTEISCKAFSVLVNDSLHGSHLSQAVTNSDSRSSRIEASSSRTYIC